MILISVAYQIQSGGYPQENGMPQDLLKTLLSADQVYCEVPFCYRDPDEEENVVWNGIMDVVYFSGGQWHIADYKTNADGDDLDQRYQAQLKAYEKAFEAITGEKAEAKIYHIAI